MHFSGPPLAHECCPPGIIRAVDVHIKELTKRSVMEAFLRPSQAEFLL